MKKFMSDFSGTIYETIWLILLFGAFVLLLIACVKTFNGNFIALTFDNILFIFSVVILNLCFGYKIREDVTEWWDMIRREVYQRNKEKEQYDFDSEDDMYSGYNPADYF